MRLSLTVLALIACGLPGLAAASDQVPTFDVRPSCRGGADAKPAYESCLKSEADARTELVKNWSNYTAAQRRACVSEAGGELPSYVELLTCLQMDAELKTLPSPNMDFGPLRKID